MKIIEVEGIVVSNTPYKESSKILNIFTREYGIIGCYSKGCKNILNIISISLGFKGSYLIILESV